MSKKLRHRTWVCLFLCHFLLVGAHGRLQTSLSLTSVIWRMDNNTPLPGLLGRERFYMCSAEHGAGPEVNACKFSLLLFWKSHPASWSYILSGILISLLFLAGSRASWVKSGQG